MKIEMIVFDMAGTTVDEGNIVYHTVHKAIQKKCPTISFESVLKWGAGKEKLQAIKDTLSNNDKNLTTEEINDIFTDFLVSLDVAYQHLLVIPTNNTERLFIELKKMGIKVVLNTGYNRTTALSLIEKLKWEEGNQFDLLVTATDVQKNRPHPDMILYAMEKLGIDHGNKVIKVGDSTIDIEEGKNANCQLTVAVTTGAHTKAELLTAAPDYIFDNIFDLKGIL